MQMSGRLLLTALMSSLLLATAMHERARGADTGEHKLTFGGIERSYLLSRPTGNAAGKLPAVIVLHGGILSAKGARRDMGFEPMVDRDGLIVAYPNAVGGLWNDGRKVIPPAWHGTAPDDIGFVRELVATLVRDQGADPARIYVTGASIGGMMTFRLICAAADVFAAAAAIIANMPIDILTGCMPARPIPVLVMNGTADRMMPDDGGPLGFRSEHGERGTVFSTDDTITWLRRFDRCDDSAERRTLPQTDPADHSSITVVSWTHCAPGTSVVLYRIEGGGHRVPSLDRRKTPIVDRMLGRENHDIEAAEVIWEFFKDKRLQLAFIHHTEKNTVSPSP
jgi:polyhydroxybutyrate depolymerase